MLGTVILLATTLSVNAQPVNAQPGDSAQSVALRESSPPSVVHVGLQDSLHWGPLSLRASSPHAQPVDGRFSPNGFSKEGPSVLLYSASLIVDIVAENVCRNRTNQSWRCDADIVNHPFYPASPDLYNPISTVNESWFTDSSRYPRIK